MDEEQMGEVRVETTGGCQVLLVAQSPVWVVLDEPHSPVRMGRGDVLLIQQRPGQSFSSLMPAGQVV